MSGIAQQVMHFKPGQALFREGEMTQDMYIIVSGTVVITITKDGAPIEVTKLGPGSFVGEMSLINGPPRTATVIAREAVTATVITSELFHNNLLGIPPWAISIARILVERLKRTTSAIGTLSTVDEAVVGDLEPPEPASSIFSIRYNPEVDKNRLYLSGHLMTRDLKMLLNRINAVRRLKISPIILNFSEVVDITKECLDYIVQVAKGSSDSTGRIALENVQLISSKIKRYEGIKDIINITSAPLRRLNPGEQLIQQGSEGREMYIVKSGQLKIFRTQEGEEILLGYAGEGDVIGEMTLISGEPRSASVQAEGSTIVYVINARDFTHNTYHIPPWFMGIVKGLVHRLQTTTIRLEEFIVKDKANKARTLSAKPDTSSNLEIFMEANNPGLVLLRGSLVSPNLPYLRNCLSRIINGGYRAIIIDTALVGTLDKAAIDYLLKVNSYVRAKGGEFEIRGPQAALLKVVQPDGTYPNLV